MNIDDADKEMAAGFGAALAMTEEAVSEAADHTAALSFARDATVYLHAPAREDVDTLKRAYLELREVQTYVELLAQLDNAAEAWKAIGSGKLGSTLEHSAAAIRNLQAAYTAANEKLARTEEDSRQLKAAIDLRNAREWKLVGKLARLRELAKAATFPMDFTVEGAVENWQQRQQALRAELEKHDDL